LRPIAEYQVEMVMPFGGLAGRHQSQAAGHAEMDQQVSVTEVQQQVFAATADGRQALSGELLLQVFRQG
jgi:hypothetical protein